MDHILQEFLTETAENLEFLEADLVQFERRPDNPELLGKIFRLFHTIKGTCGFIGLPRLEAVAHAGETVLDWIRGGALSATPEAIALIFAAVDRVKEIIAALEETGCEPTGNDASLIARLDAYAAAVSLKSGDSDTASADTDAANTTAPVPPASVPEVSVREASGPAALLAVGAARPDAISGQSIRVNRDLLDEIMTTVSDLVLTRNQFQQLQRISESPGLESSLQRLSSVTANLQESVMRTRMQTVGTAWAGLPRLVRDLGRELGKKIDLRTIGAETELDREVLESVKDPLIHMVRNSADHGLESTDRRLAAGKPETGTITLNAFHQGGQVVIEVGDDGAGLDTARIRERALRLGLVRDGDGASLSDRQVHDFIFDAGFSTASAVTALSGRGVGMDVVRSNIEKIGGTIELRSHPGEGTVFAINIPLTLAIISALIIRCAGERFAIPQADVSELVQAGKESGHRIEYIQKTPVLRSRNRLLPLVSLRDLLGVGVPPQPGEAEFVAVVNGPGGQFGIIADGVFDAEEIVVKPVAPVLQKIPYYAGSTVMGDGAVIMILDPHRIAGDVDEVLSASLPSLVRAAARPAKTADRQPVLLFRAGTGGPKGVAMASVARIEEIDVGTIENVGGNRVIRYRGETLPLAVLAEGPLAAATGADRWLPVIIIDDCGRMMGLMVDEIIDIADGGLRIARGSARPGFLGSMAVAGKATDMIDVPFYLSDYLSVATGDRPEMAAALPPVDGQGRVLLVDDTAFFRDLLSPVLAMAGYEVTTAESAERALELHAGGLEIDVIVSDIDMPGMDGFEFASAVRAGGRWADTPIVALASHGVAEDIERGRAAGFDGCVAKFDRERLVRSLDAAISLGRMPGDAGPSSRRAPSRERLKIGTT